MTILQSSFLYEFTCLGEACADTCCKGWDMQLDDATKARWEKTAPELLQFMSQGSSGNVMKRDESTDYCVKLQDGLCSIHSDKGSEMLGDACYFFPRMTRKLGQNKIMTAAMSCPESARLALFPDNNANPFSYIEAVQDRQAPSSKDYLTSDLDDNTALSIHNTFLEASNDQNSTAERIIARISSVARSLEMIDISSWGMAVPFYIKSADERLLPPESNPNDVFNLLQALAGLVAAANPSPRPRLQQTIRDIEESLNAKLSGDDTVAIMTNDDSFERWQAMEKSYHNEWQLSLAPILRNYIQAQIALSLFPFAGLGESLEQRITIIGVRFATVRLALISLYQKHGNIPPQDEIIRVIQSISRFLDHLADPALSLCIYDETGWIKDSRLRSLIGDN